MASPTERSTSEDTSLAEAGQDQPLDELEEDVIATGVAAGNAQPTASDEGATEADLKPEVVPVGGLEDDGEGASEAAAGPSEETSGHGVDDNEEPAAEEPGKDDPRVEALTDRVSQLSEALESMQGDRDNLASVSEQFSTMQQNLKSLQHLSELLSVRYNPFLEGHEENLFDGDRNSPHAIVDNLQKGAGGAGSQPPPPVGTGHVETPDVQEPTGSPLTKLAEPETIEDPGAEAADAEAITEDPSDPASGSPTAESTRTATEKTPADKDLEAMQQRPADVPDAPQPVGPRRRPPPLPRPSHASPVRRPQDSSMETAVKEEATRTAAEPLPGPAPGARHPAGSPLLEQERDTTFGVRETFLVMTWFEHLIGDRNPSVIYVFLDYYRDVEWLSKEAYQRMVDLAKGIAKPRDNASWSTFGLKPQDLIKMHMASLRFFDFLFRINLDPSEEKELQRKLAKLLEAD